MNLIVWYINLLSFCGQNNFWYLVSIYVYMYVCLSEDSLKDCFSDPSTYILRQLFYWPGNHQVG